MASELNESERYLVEEALGEGGLGHVYRAWDRELSRPVAIKRLFPGPDVEQRLREEAEVLAAMNHPNIVTIYDVASDEDGPFVVMELLEGQTLEECVTEEGTLSLAMFQPLVEQICRGLSAAHSYGVIHRDIKPGNVMIQWHADGSFSAKLLDFGMAIESMRDDGQGETVTGTIFTIAPEQICRQPASELSDLYALGCVLYYCLTGRFPYEGETVEEIIEAHLSKRPPPIDNRPDLAPDMYHVIARMMARQPEDRFGSVEEARLAMHDALKRSNWEMARVRLRRTVPRRSGPMLTRRATSQRVLTWWIAGVSLLLLAAAIVAAIRTWTQSSTGDVAAQPARAVAPPAVAIPEDVQVAPEDFRGLAERTGLRVRSEGAIAGATRSAAVGLVYLDFSDSNPNALRVAIPAEDPRYPESVWRSLVGRRVEVEGILEEVGGRFIITIQGDATLKDQGPASSDLKSE